MIITKAAIKTADKVYTGWKAALIIRDIIAEKGDKLCSGCATVKPKSDFYRRYRGNPNKLQNVCKPCAYARSRGYFYSRAKEKI